MGSASLFVLLKLCTCVFSRLSRVQLFVTLWTIATRLLCPWILQVKILEWVAVPFSRGSFQRRNQTWVPCIAGGFFTIWATKEAQCYSLWGHKDSDTTEWLNNNKSSPGNSSAVKAEFQYTKSKVYVNFPFSNSSRIALSGTLGRIPCLLMKYKYLHGLLWWLR